MNCPKCGSDKFSIFTTQINGRALYECDEQGCSCSWLPWEQSEIDKLKIELEQEAQADVEIQEIIKTLTEDNDRLRGLLKQIEERRDTCEIDHAALFEEYHPLTYRMGIKAGHRCAAEIAKKTKEGK